MYEALGSVSRGRRMQRKEGGGGRVHTVYESALKFTAFPNGLVYSGRCKTEVVIVFVYVFQRKVHWKKRGLIIWVLPMGT